VAEFEGSGLSGFGRATALFAFEKRDDRHGMAMSESKVSLEPGDHGTRFHARFELTALRVTFIRREPAEVCGAFARFRLDVVEVGLE
jgi:hypothetical protein